MQNQQSGNHPHFYSSETKPEPVKKMSVFQQSGAMMSAVSS